MSANADDSVESKSEDSNLESDAQESQKTLIVPTNTDVDIAVSEKVKCKACKKVLPKRAYSKKQLRDLDKHVSTHGPLSLARAGVIKCKVCVGVQIT